MSREHIVSESILENMIRVQGFSWCKDIPKTIPATTYKSKILCKYHNEQLSPSDNEIKKFIFTFKSYFENSMDYDKNRSKYTRLPIRFSVSGNLIEIWFCKTLINVATLNSTDADIPIEEVLPYLYQGKKFLRPYGLSFAVKTGDSIKSQDNTIVIEPLFHTETEKVRLLIGGLFILRSFTFVILFPTKINPIKDNKLPLSPQNKEWEGKQLNWHNKEITEFKQRPSMKVLFQVVNIDWEN